MQHQIKTNRLGVQVFPPSSNPSGFGDRSPIRGHLPDEQPLPPYSTNDFGNYRISSRDRPPGYHPQSDVPTQRISPNANQQSPTKFGNNYYHTNHASSANSAQSPSDISSNHRATHAVASNHYSPTKYANNYQSETEAANHRINYGAAVNTRQSPNKFSNQRANHGSATLQSTTEIGNLNHRINHAAPATSQSSPTEVSNPRINHGAINNHPSQFGSHGSATNVQSQTQSHRINNSVAINHQKHMVSHAAATYVQSPTEVANHRINYSGAATNLQSPTKVDRISHTSATNYQSPNKFGEQRASHGSAASLQSPNEIANHRISHAAAPNLQSPNESHRISHAAVPNLQSPNESHRINHVAAANLQSPNEVGNHKISHIVASNARGEVTNTAGVKPQDYHTKPVHPFRLHRSLPLNDTESTHLFTFLLTLDNIDDLRETPQKSSIASYQGHKWYLTSGVYMNNDGVEFLGVFLYWLTKQNSTVGGNEVDIKCSTDYRIIVRNVINPAESKISEGAQMEYSPSMTTGWGKRELILLQELCSRGNGFINEPGSLVIVELAMKSCTTTFEHHIDVSHLGTQTFQDQNQYPAHFTPNFSIGAYEFYLSVYPRGDRDKARNCISMYLHRFSSSSDLLGCRVRFRFFVGKRISPSNGATFDYVFKENKGYGKYKAFEPLATTDFMSRSSILTVGVDIVSVTPLAQVEVPLVTRGYYHTDNFIFDEVVFPDHNFNYWKLSVDNSNTMLQLKFDTEDKEMLQTTDGNKTSCTKFLQWRAFVISRKDKKKSKAVLACPLTSFFSRHLPDSEVTMSTQIPLQTAKELNGDYCTKQEPSLLIRLEILDLQDLPEAVHEQPVLHFERIQLYHMRDGFRRCMKVQNRLEMQIDEVKKRMNELLHDRRVGKEDAFQQIQAILQIHENTPNAASPAALPHSLDVPSEASEPLSDSIDGSLNTSWLPPPFVNHHVPETIEADPHAGIMQTDL